MDKIEIIQLDAEDDIVSICDRLDWFGEKQVLLELPSAEGLLENGLDLARLRRYADRKRIEIGLITADKQLRRQANALGLPAFATAEEGQGSPRGWWRGRRRQERVGLPTTGGDRFFPWRDAPIEEDGTEPKPISRRHWMIRYLAILLFFLAMAFLYVGFSYFLPKATITIKPRVLPLQATLDVTADPMLEGVDFQNTAVPGRLLEITQSWQSEVETTGSTSVPVSPARGQVVFVNQTDEAVIVPQGTRLSTNDGRIVFQTIAPLTMIGVVSSTAEIDIVAIEPGPQSNVEAGEIKRIENGLEELLLVNNPAAMSGGDVREVATVTEEDMARLRSQVLQFLQAVSLAEMETRLNEREFLARESLQVIEIALETFSHNVGEQTEELRLKMEATVQGTAVDLSQASGLVYDALSAQVPSGLTLVTSSIQYVQEDVLRASEQGRVVFSLRGRGLVADEVDMESILPEILGQDTAVALAYLYEELPLREVPSIDVWPNWFKRVPFLPSRIETAVLLDE